MYRVDQIVAMENEGTPETRSLSVSSSTLDRPHSLSHMEGRSKSQQLQWTSSMRSILQEVDPATIRPPNTGWSSQLEFMFTCISYAVGLGNVWRFPYLCYKNGGGAFLFPYCVMLIIVGMPVFFLELSFGQFASLGPLTIWSVNPLFKGLGYGMVTVCLVVGLYYNVIIAQCFLYLAKSFCLELPWDSCGNGWNTPDCVEPSFVNRTDETEATVTLKTNYTYDGEFAIAGTKTEEFYYNFVLHQSPEGISNIGVPQWRLVLCLLAAWCVVALGLIKGVKSLGKISYFTALFPYCMLTVLLIRSCLLPGASDGIIYYLTPHWDRLKDIIVWQEAAIQIFYNLSCATGGLIAMASFNTFRNNCLRDALIVPILNALTSVFAGLVVFSILGFMAYTKNTTIDKVASDGPGLVFIAYPEALAKLPFAPIWSVLFFLMMLTLGFGSQLSMVECVLTAFQDDLHQYIDTKTKKIVYRISMCVVCFLLGLPMICRGGIYVLQLVDFFIAFLSLLLICLLELIVLTWIYGFPDFAICKDVKMMLNRDVPLFYRVMWRFVTPVFLFALIIASMVLYQAPEMSVGGIKLPFPDWAITVGWLIAVFPTLLIPGWMAYYYCYLGGFEILRDHNLPLVNWGPREHDDRIDRYAEQTERIAAHQEMRISAYLDMRKAVSQPALAMTEMQSPQYGVTEMRKFLDE